MLENEKIFQNILITLLKNIIYLDDNPKLWSYLLQQRVHVENYFNKINLKLYIDESEGYAFLKQNYPEEQVSADDNLDNEEEIITTDNISVNSSINNLQLISKRQLNFMTSLLCLLLRKKLLEFEISGGGTRAVIKKEEIVETLKIYLKDNNNEQKLRNNIEISINKVLELGFLQKLKNNLNSYEIKRIIKAFVDAKWLNTLDEKLKEYYDYGNATK